MPLSHRPPGMIHVERFGRGAEVVMVHGWGMHLGVWREFARALSTDFRITLVDLPGHGRSGMIEDYSLEGISQALLAVAPQRAHWLGWSLGAKIALSLAAHHPQRVDSLTMLAGNVRFSQADDWPFAMDLTQLSRFADDMIRDYHMTLMKFLGLQTWGLENAKEALKALKAQVAECAEPQSAALLAGLTILHTADLRAELSALQVPVLFLLGSRDRLVPPAAGPAMQSLLGGAELQILDRAAHTPFLSHPKETQDLLSDFWFRNASIR